MVALGDAVRLRLGPKQAIVLSHPEMARHLLVTHVRNYVKQTPAYAGLRLVLGNGLLTSDGDFWLRQRRLAQPAFHKKHVAGFGEVMARAATGMVDRWEAGFGDPKGLDVSHEMMRVTLRVVGEALLTADPSQNADEVGGALTEGLEYLMHLIQTPLAPPPWVPTRRNRGFHRAVATLDRVVLGIIAERRRTGPGPGDLLDLLMGAQDEETGATMTDRQLRDEVMTLFLAGHETTAMALTWTFHLLSEHPETEAALRRELDEVLGGRPPTTDDVPKLDLLGRVVQESMRLYPPVWTVSRTPVEADTVDGHAVHPGDLVMLPIHQIHRRPDLWPDPDRFDPDRFLPEAVAGRPRFAYLPFIGGQRQCIGDGFANLEARLVLATVLQRVRMTPVEGRPPVLPRPLVTLRTANGLWMRLDPA